MPVLRHAPLFLLTSLLAIWAGPAALAQPITEAGLRAGIGVNSLIDDVFPDRVGLPPLLRDRLGVEDGLLVVDPATGEPAVETLDDIVAAESTINDLTAPEQPTEAANNPLLPAAEPEEDLEESEQDPFDPPPPGLEGVTTRQRPELEAPGLRVGGFTVSSDTEAAVETTDNVLAVGRERASDTLYVVRPQVSMRSNWTRHSFGVEYAGAYGTYANTPSQNPRSTRLAADGRLDVTHGTAIALRSSLTLDREGAGDVDVAEGAEQIPFRVAELGGEFTRRVNRLSGALRGTLTVYDYDDSAGPFGAPVNNDDRDQTQTGVGLRLAYELSPATSVFADAYYVWGRHRFPVDDLGFARDSQRRTLAAGVVLRPSRLVEIEASAGHVREDFADAHLAPVDEATANARLAWAVTPLTTISAEFATDIGATTLADASAAVGRTLRGEVDHELFRNLIVRGSASFNRTDYPGIALEEKTATAGAGAEYRLTRGAALVARYERSAKSSNEPDNADVIEDRATIGVRLRR